MNALIFEATLRTIALGVVVSVLSGAVGCLLAWLITRTQLLGSRWLSGFLSIPYALPAYLLGMAWIVLGNPTVGLLKFVFPSSGIYGFWGIVFVETSVAFVFPYLELKAGFDRLDSSLEESARMSGASAWQTFRDISFPLLWPSLLNGMCIVFLYAISSFGVPALLGLPVREFVLTTLIYSELKLGGASGIATALRLSGLLLFIAIIILLISNRLIHFSKSKHAAILSAKSSRPSRIRLGKGEKGISLLVWIFFGTIVLLPWMALLFSTLAPIAGSFSPKLWTLKNLSYVLLLPDFQEALFNSVIVTSTVSLLILLIGFVLAFYKVRRKNRLAHIIIETLGIPFSTPGTIIAVLLILISSWFNRLLENWNLSLDSPLFWIGVAYSIKFSAICARMLVSAFSQVHPALEEAARISGGGTFQILRDIWMPLLKKSLVAAWMLVALPMFTELTMSVLLTGPKGATLGTILFQLQEYADQPSAAALAWMLLSTAIAVAVFTRSEESA